MQLLKKEVEIPLLLIKNDEFRKKSLFNSAPTVDINQIDIVLLTETLPCYQIQSIKALILAEAIVQTLSMAGIWFQGSRNRSQQHLPRDPNLEILCFSKQIQMAIQLI